LASDGFSNASSWSNASELIENSLPSFTNVSLTYPNSTLALNNVPMVDSGGALWTYEFCNTTGLGRYDINGVGDLEGVNTGFDCFIFYS